MRFAVVGHVEWVQFARVEHVPRPGEVVHARDGFEEPAGGGAVVAVQLARLAGSATLYTALGDDEVGRRSIARMRELGVDVRAQIVDRETRRAVTLVDGAGERTITTFGGRLEPAGDAADLEGLRELDGVYFTAGDTEALRVAREGARVLVASPRARHALGQGVELDALVLSADDQIERRAAEPVESEAGLVVMTEGERGGGYTGRDGTAGRWKASPLPGEVIDTYGCGDSFAAGLTFGLGAGMAREQAVELAARCGACCLTGRGPYGRQLGGDELGTAPRAAGDSS